MVIHACFLLVALVYATRSSMAQIWHTQTVKNLVSSYALWILASVHVYIESSDHQSVAPNPFSSVDMAVTFPIMMKDGHKNGTRVST